MKKSEYSILFILTVIFFYLLSSGLSTNNLYSQIPVPNCVCAECDKKCGTGHEKTCSSYSKKSTDGYKDMSEKSISEKVVFEGLEIFTDNGKILKVTNTNDFEVRYSFEYDLTENGQVISITGNNYIIKPNSISINLFTATENAVITRVQITEAFKYIK